MRGPWILTVLLAGGLAGCDDPTADPDARPVEIDGGSPDARPDAGIDAGIDAGPPGPADAGPPLTGDELSSPGDFPRIACEPGSMAGFTPTGVWHLDTRFDYGGGFVEQWNAVLSLYQESPESELSASFDGAAASVVRHDDNDLLLRRVNTDDAGNLGVLGLDACKQNDDGSLEGALVQCSDYFPEVGYPQCIAGSFRAVLVKPLVEAPARGLSLLGEYAGEPLQGWPGDILPVNVRARDGVAYLVGHNDGLRVIDVSDPAAMFELGHHHTEHGYNDVKLVDRAADGKRYALCSSDYRGVDVIDVTDPTRPTFVTNFSEAGSVHTLFIESKAGVNRAYLPDYSLAVDSAGSPELSVWNIDDPESPIQLGRYILPTDEKKGGGFIHDLMVKDGIAYLNYWNRGLVWVDTNDPTAIAQVGLFDSYERRTSHSNWVTEVNGCLVSVHGDEDFGAHLRTIGVDPRPACADQFGKQLGEVSLRPEVSIHNIMAFGTTAYVAYYQDGVRLFDLSNPAEPELDRWFNTWQGGPGEAIFEGAVGIDVDLAAGRIYVADIPRGLLVLSIDELE